VQARARQRIAVAVDGLPEQRHFATAAPTSRATSSTISRAGR
jgi:hypothetical protein